MVIAMILPPPFIGAISNSVVIYQSSLAHLLFTDYVMKIGTIGLFGKFHLDSCFWIALGVSS